MNIIREGDKRVFDIIGRKNIKADRDYRMSTYTYAYSEDSQHLILSTLTGEIVSLSDSEWSLIDPENNPVISGASLEGKGFEVLTNNCILVYKDDDDYERYQLAVSILKAMEKKKGVHTYTILPTTGCNARCTYCYEEGMKICTMSDSTARQVVEFIAKTRGDEEITISWFGGEPLVGSKIISYICTSLNERGIPFKSKMITNASLVMPQLLDEAVNNWHLKSVQVSADGARCDYESRKLFADPKKHNYDKLIEVVGLFLERDIKVTLRCNYDQDNIEGMYSFWEDVYNRYGKSDKLSINAAMLFQAHDSENCVELAGKMLELKYQAIERGILHPEISDKPFKMKSNYCMADSDGRCVVISPEGDLYHCEHLPGNSSFGSIFDETYSITSDERAFKEVAAKCKGCKFLPGCTTFYCNGCPDYFEYCDKVKAAETEIRLRKQIH